MSLTRIAVFLIGLVLAVFGVFYVVQGPIDALHLVVGLVLVIVGVYILSGRGVSL